jgi:hypothetical protein
MKHFEQLWEEAEDLSHKLEKINYKNALQILRQNIDNIVDAKVLETNEAEAMGEILFALSFLSKKLNINVFTALQYSIEERKIENYG